MKVLKTSEVLKLLLKDGWVLQKRKSTNGSHRQLKHPTKKGKVTVHGKESEDLFGNTLKSIEKQSGLKF